jgi:superfamily II DNA or RNA helicase
MSNQNKDKDKDKDKNKNKTQQKNKSNINTKTSLSNQGYSIYKTQITEKEIKDIKDDLTIKPFSCPGYGNPEDIEPYKLYKENEDKLYVPNFYGKTKYGNAEKIKLNEPETTTLAFSPDRQMRDYQKDIIKTYITSAKKIGGGIISVGCGRGKCLEKGTIIPLYNDNSKKVEDLVEGDTLIGDDGSPRIILSLGSGVSPMFEVNTNTHNHKKLYNNKTNIISNFKTYTVNQDHILTLFKDKDNKINNNNTLNSITLYNTHTKTLNQTNIIDISILDYLSLSEEEQNKYYGLKLPLKFLCLRYVKNIVKKNYYDRNDTINDINNVLLTFPKNITNVNPSYAFYIGYIIGIKLNLFNNKNNNYNDNNYIPNSIEDITNITNTLKNENIMSFINTIKISDLKNYFNKHKLNFQAIIDLYIGILISFNSKKIDLYLDLETMIDSKNYFKHNSKEVFNLFIELLDTIGITYKITFYLSSTIKILTINDKYNEYYDHSIIPITIKSKGEGEYYGFQLSDNGRFILSDRTLTHNTVMGLKIAEELKVKTLILVHKEFLMNQWVERITEYLPEAKVGYIQGKKCDINRKDIVLAMIQSLSDPRKDKDYPANLFESFGLVIADECHHLAARQFCRSLAKYPFKYTLGLSATPDRADGLQRVFKHYLGDIVYKDVEIQQSEEDIRLEHIPNSNVELYIYNNSDHNYSKEALNYQKKPNIVTMKSNVANCLKRTKFLLSFLPRLIEEGRTILILSCRRNHISEMETLINDMAIPNCSVGLYVGGMKQSNLDISATKRIIIATYDMAEEAFDCKTLNTLIFGTPHKNIKQAVGRILREEKKKRKMIPLIIDLQDVFSSFNSWNKLREKYYKTEEYPLKVFNVIDKPDLKFKPEIKFIKDISNRKTTKTKTNKDTKNKKSSFIIDMDMSIDNKGVVEGDTEVIEEDDDEDSNNSGDDVETLDF